MTSYQNKNSVRNSGLLMFRKMMFNRESAINISEDKCQEEITDSLVSEAILKAGQSDTEEETTDPVDHNLLARSTARVEQSRMVSKVDSLMFLRRKPSSERVVLDEVSSSSLLDDNEVGNLLESEYAVRRVRSESDIFHDNMRRSQDDRAPDLAEKSGLIDKNERRDSEIGSPKSFLHELPRSLPGDSGDQEPVSFDSLFTQRFRRPSNSNESIKSQCSCECSSSSTMEIAASLIENMDKQIANLFDYLSWILPIFVKHVKFIPTVSNKEYQSEKRNDDDVDDESCPQLFHADKEESVNKQTNMELKDLEVALKNARNIAGDVSELWRQHRYLLIEIMKEAAQLENMQKKSTERTRRLCDVIKTLKSELKSVQMFLQEKEEEWLTTERSLKADTLFLQSGISEIMKTQPDEPRLWSTLDSLLCIQHNREKAFALDCAKQNKINELRLLIYKQQLQLAESREKNKELERELENVLGGVPQLMNTNNNDDEGLSLLKNVLYCDHCQYIPGCSTNPQYASLKVLNIGGNHENLCSREEQIFNPCLLYKGCDSQDSYNKYTAQEMLEELTRTGPASRVFSLKETDA